MLHPDFKNKNTKNKTHKLSVAVTHQIRDRRVTSSIPPCK